MDLNGLSNLLMNLGSPHEFLVQHFKDPVVFHYTDLGGLRGIVTDRDLWLTNSRFLNDYEEGEHGMRVVEEVIAVRSSRPDLEVEEREFAQAVKQRLDASDDQGVYVCCFCLVDNLLGQWRSYGANGTGVSLGFDTDQFQNIAGPDIPPEDVGLIYLWRVFYGPGIQRKIVEDCLEIARRHGEGSNDDKLELAVDAIRFFVPTFKNEKFSEEREARLVFRPSSKCRVRPTFRVGRGMLVPFYRLKEIVKAAGHASWQPPLKSVLVGPGTNKTINRQGVKLLLEHAEYGNIPVDVSDTPYRG